jgi:hypothetical protein
VNTEYHFSITNLGLLLPEYNISNRGFQGHYQQRQEKQDMSKFLVYLAFLDIGLLIFPFVDLHLSGRLGCIRTQDWECACLVFLINFLSIYLPNVQ